MNKKIFLTSALAMGFIVPAFAEQFPTDGYMKENKTYDEAATFENTGVYDGEVDANAEYDNTPYSVAAGLYFTGVDSTSNDAITAACTAGSYCPGVTSTTYDYTTDLFENAGIQSCPTIDNTAFTSDAGSSALTNCYDEDSAMSSAELNPFDTAHLDKSVSGNGYINGVKYKSETTAARRYATSATAAGEWAALDESDLAITDLACVNGYHYKAGTTGPDLTSLIGITEAGDNYGCKSNSGTGKNQNEDKYGLQNGEFVVGYGSKGKIHGHAQCSTQQGYSDTVNQKYGAYNNPTITATLPDSSGRFCYCQLDNYTPVSGTATALSAPWVFSSVNFDAADCASDCAMYCTSALQSGGPNTLPFRAAVFGSVQSTPAMCEANTITINWSDAETADITANNAGVATYDGDVRTPVKAKPYKGKTFKGWRFSKPTTTQLPE